MASDGGGGAEEVEFYKSKNNVKDNISCLFLSLVLSKINDGAYMQPCKNLFHAYIDSYTI